MEKELGSKQSLPVSQGVPLIIQNYENGIYNGNANKGLCYGKGVFWWDSGELFFGEWEEAKIHGEGIFFFPYGGYLKGFFFKNKINGAAFLKFPNGDFYQGFWRHGKLDGKCFKYFADFNSWALCTYSKGVFQKCLNKGRGQPNITFEERLSMHIDSKFVEQGRDDVGVIHYQDGGKYYGVIQGGVPHGLGITYYLDGKFDAGLYQNGILQGAGRLIMENGDIFEGCIKDGQVNGKGFFYKKETDKWIFGNFRGQNEVEVLNKGQGFPLEEIIEWKRQTHLFDLPQVNIIIPNDLFYIPLLEETQEEPKKQLQKSPRNTRSQPSSARVKINLRQKTVGEEAEYRRLLNLDSTPSDSSKTHKSKSQIVSSNKKGDEIGPTVDPGSERALLEQNLEKDFEMLERATEDGKNAQKSSMAKVNANINTKVSSEQGEVLEQLSENLQRVAAGLRLSLQEGLKPSEGIQQERHAIAKGVKKDAKPNLEIEIPSGEILEKEGGAGFEYVYKKFDSPSPKKKEQLTAFSLNNLKQEIVTESKVSNESEIVRINQEGKFETEKNKNNRGAPSFDLDAEKKNSFFTMEENPNNFSNNYEVENTDIQMNVENPFKSGNLSVPKASERMPNEIKSPEFVRKGSKGEETAVNQLRFNETQKDEQEKPLSTSNWHYRTQSVQEQQQQELNEDSYSVQSISRSEFGPTTGLKEGNARKNTINEELEDNFYFQANKGVLNQAKEPRDSQNENGVVAEERKYEADSLNLKANTLSNLTGQESSAEFAIKDNINVGSKVGEALNAKQKCLLEDKEIQTDFPVASTQPKSTPRTIMTIQNYFSELPPEQESKQVVKNLSQDYPEEFTETNEITKKSFEMLEENNPASKNAETKQREKPETHVNAKLDLEFRALKKSNDDLKSEYSEMVVEENNEMEYNQNLNFQQSNERLADVENPYNSKEEKLSNQPSNEQAQNITKQHSPRKENLLKRQKSENLPQEENANASTQQGRKKPQIQPLNLESINSITEGNSNLENRGQPEPSNLDQNTLNLVPQMEKNNINIPNQQGGIRNKLQSNVESVANPSKSIGREIYSPVGNSKAQNQYIVSPSILNQRPQPIDSHDSTKNFAELTSKRPSLASGQLLAVYTSINPSPRQSRPSEGQLPGLLGVYQSQNPVSSASASNKGSLVNSFDGTFDLKSAHQALDDILKRAKGLQYDNQQRQINSPPGLSRYFGQYQTQVEPSKNRFPANSQSLRSQNDKSVNQSLPNTNLPNPNSRLLNDINRSPIPKANLSNDSQIASRDSSLHQSKPLKNFLARSPNNLIEHSLKLSPPSSNPKIIHNTSLEDIPPSKIIGPALTISPERRSNSSINYSPVANRYRDIDQGPPHLSYFAKRDNQQPDSQGFRGDSRLGHQLASTTQDYRQVPDSYRVQNHSSVRNLPEDDRSEAEDERGSLFDDNIFEKAPDQRPMFDKSVVRLKKEVPIPYIENPVGSQPQSSRQGTSNQESYLIRSGKKSWAQRMADESEVTDSRIESIGRLTEENAFAFTLGTFNHDNIIFTANAESRTRLSAKDQHPIVVYEEARLPIFETDESLQNQITQETNLQTQGLRESESSKAKGDDFMRMDFEKLKKYGQIGLSQIEETVDESIGRSIGNMSISRRKKSPRDSQEDTNNSPLNYSKIPQPLADSSRPEANQKRIFDFSVQPRSNAYNPSAQFSEPKNNINNSRTKENRPRILDVDTLDVEDRKVIRRSPAKSRVSTAQDRESFSNSFSRDDYGRTSSEISIEERLNTITEKARQDIARRREQNSRDNCIIF